MNRIQHFNLIDVHQPGFRALSDPKLQHFSRVCVFCVSIFIHVINRSLTCFVQYRRRREKQLKLMRFLALAPPEM